MVFTLRVVTAEEFARWVTATGARTTAERAGTTGG
jgi:hypothetical protein